MNKKEAEDLVYRSYVKAEKYQQYDEKDAVKRRPDLTRDIIRKRAGTPAVVVTGSKGKGSVASLISQILQTRYKVGLMTSPHLVDFCERFKINGQNIRDDEFVRQMALIQNEIEAVEAHIPENVCISPMGIQADLALAFFQDQHTQYNVFECGKGARFDDVNNVRHEYAVINSIFPEHTRELGETVEAIAEDKAYVITGEQKCVYVARQKPSVMKVIWERADRLGVPVKVYGRDFYAEKIRYSHKGMVFDAVIEEERYADILVPLLGEHQARNCVLAMALCKDVLGELDIDRVKERVAETDWPGRMEVLSAEPFIMLDACIVAASCDPVKDVVRQLGIDEITAIIGIPDDKDYAGVAGSMKEIASDIILTRSQNPHYVFTQQQQAVLAGRGVETIWADSMEEAVGKGRALGRPIVIIGTTSVVSEVKKLQLSGKL